MIKEGCQPVSSDTVLQVTHVGEDLVLASPVLAAFAVGSPQPFFSVWYGGEYASGCGASPCGTGVTCLELCKRVREGMKDGLELCCSSYDLHSSPGLTTWLSFTLDVEKPKQLEGGAATLHFAQGRQVQSTTQGRSLTGRSDMVGSERNPQ